MDPKYVKLVSEFPLLPITSKTEHAAAKQMMIELTKRDGDLSPVEIGYGKVLTQLIQAYERVHVGGFFDDVSGSEALEYLLERHGLRQAEAADIAGISRQNLNDFLKGRRGLSKDARLNLAKHFKVDAEVFEVARQESSA